MKKLQILAVEATITKDYANNPLPDGSIARSYQNVTFSQPLEYTDEEGEVLVNMAPKTSKQAIFNYNFLDNKANPMFGFLTAGKKVAGDIVTVDTEPYEIDERRNGVPTGNKVTLTKDTFLVFADSDDQEAWDAAVEAARIQRVKQRAKQVISAATVPGASV